jgi:uncharacterized protein
MVVEARYILAEEPDIHDTALYHAVLAAIAEGNTCPVPKLVHSR